ncbi:spore protease YyaC [Aquibacillus salsiterrae]|uniref:Spore protease YyaC n=1 Tax=Aquibacillus salsiterrae TaxID=2950439 RepID=A0A9X3WEV1_9BACI|nr:spore protease YyaC [Aquibacillus salsiterrae]MDC3417718.1 spore protease YyaC [Aquibacillus salsiterrae]
MNLKTNLSQKNQTRLSVEDNSMPFKLMQSLINQLPSSLTEIVVICIGTDRSTGDSLGPLTGTLLSERKTSTIHVYGTLQDPIHAVNLVEKLEAIEKEHPNTFIIAVDACLGRVKSIGNVITGNGPIQPGKALNKELPSVGNIHISGVVNVSGYMEFLVLQNTRLHVVMQMAKKIAQAMALLDHHLLKNRDKVIPLPNTQAKT